MAERDFVRAVSKSLMAGVIGFMVAGQFVTVAYYPYFWINLAFMISLNNLVINSTAKEKRNFRSQFNR